MWHHVVLAISDQLVTRQDLHKAHKCKFWERARVQNLDVCYIFLRNNIINPCSTVLTEFAKVAAWAGLVQELSNYGVSLKGLYCIRLFELKSTAGGSNEQGIRPHYEAGGSLAVDTSFQNHIFKFFLHRRHWRHVACQRFNRAYQPQKSA